MRHPFAYTGPSHSRTASIKLYKEDRRLHFTSQGVAAQGFSFYDCDVLDDHLYEVGAKLSGGIYHMFTRIDKGAWTESPCLITADCHMGIDGSTIYYAAAGSTCTATPPYEVGSVLQAGEHQAYAPISDSVFYTLDEATVAGPVVYGGVITRHYFDLGSWHTQVYDGRIYDANLDLSRFDAIENGEIEYIFFSDYAGKRTMFLTHVHGQYGEQHSLIPLDILDIIEGDTLSQTHFKLGLVSMIADRIFVTGELKRPYCDPMIVYTMGPDHWTMGRELFIDTPHSTPLGKVLALGTHIEYHAPDTWLQAEGNSDLGIPQRTEVGQGSGMNLSFPANAPSNLNLTLAKGAADIPPGYSLDLYIVEDELDFLMGTFDADVPTRGDGAMGSSHVVVARGNAGKRLNQWQSDSSYDYLSQTKMASLGSNLGELVRYGGSWKVPVTGGVTQDYTYLETLNERHYLYSVASPCRNGTTVLRVETNATTAQPNPAWETPCHYTIGLGTCFTLETRPKAAERLNKDIDDIEDADCGANGLFYRYAHDGVAWTWHFIQMVNGVETDFGETLLQMTPAAIPPHTEYQFMMQFKDGWVALWYKKPLLPWQQLDNRTLESANPPWLEDDRGRSAIFIENNSPHTTCLPFSSDDDFIPVQDVSPFTMAGSGVVLVDEEKILVSGRTCAAPVFSGTPYTAPELVANFIMGIGEIPHTPFGDLRTRDYLIIPISTSIGGKTHYWITDIGLQLHAVNTPCDLEVAIWRGSFDQDMGRNGTILATTQIPANQIDPALDGVTAHFSSPVEVNVGQDYILCYRAGQASINDGNGYSIAYSGSVTPTCYTYNDDDDHWHTIGGGAGHDLFGWEVAPPADRYPVSLSMVPDEVGFSYQGLILVLTDDQGIKTCYRIGQRTVTEVLPGIYTTTFWLTKSPGAITTAVSASFAAALNVAANGRGYATTVPTSHAMDTLVSTFMWPKVYTYEVQAFSANEDWHAFDYAYEICRKAGIWRVETDTWYDPINLILPGGYDMSGQGIPHVAFVADMDCEDFTNEVGVGVKSGSDYYYVTCDGTNLYLKVVYGVQQITDQLNLALRPRTEGGHLRISFWERYLSVWIDGTHEMTWVIPEEAVIREGSAHYVSKLGIGLNALWSQCDIRVDSFILDMGSSGMQLLQTMLGEKRIFFSDTDLGGIRFHMVRPEHVDPYDLVAENGMAYSDAIMATRARIEGVEVHERFDADLMKKYGNIYKSLNMQEVNNLTDAMRVSKEVLEDLNSQVVTVGLAGTPDLRVEANDIVLDSLSRKVIVDQVVYHYNLTLQDVLYSMEVNGRWPRENL